MSNEIQEQIEAKPISKKEYWSNIISDWESSGLTQPVFCKQRSVNHATFQYWRTSLQKTKQAKAIRFVTPQVKETEIPKNPTGQGLQFQIKTQHATIDVYNHTNPSLIKLILQSVGLKTC